MDLLQVANWAHEGKQEICLSPCGLVLLVRPTIVTQSAAPEVYDIVNICVTGGAGYIGSVLTERLLSLGHKVTVVDTFLHGYHGIMRLAGHPSLTIINRDIRHENRDYLNKQDVVFHLAAISNIKACEENKALAWDVNRTATVDIAKHLHRDALLIFASSTAMYGDRGGRIVPDGVILYSTQGVYSQAKLDAEQVIQNDDNTIVIRLATVYGVSPLMRPNSIVNDFVRMAVQDKRIVLYDDLTTRPYIHIQDCVSGLIESMENRQGTRGEHRNLWATSYKKNHVVRLIHNQLEFEVLSLPVSDGFIQDFQLEFFVQPWLNHNLPDAVRDLIKLYSFYKP